MLLLCYHVLFEQEIAHRTSKQGRAFQAMFTLDRPSEHSSSPKHSVYTSVNSFRCTREQDTPVDIIRLGRGCRLCDTILNKFEPKVVLFIRIGAL